MIKSLLKFARVRIVVTMYALAFLGSAAVGDINTKTILTFFLIFAVTVHANSINDYVDQKIDAINLKKATDRPFVTKNLSLHNFWIIHFLSGIIALIVSLFYGTSAFILTIGMLIIDYLYSLKPFLISYRPILSPLLLSLAYVYYPFSLGVLSSNSGSEYPWALSISLFFAFVARMLLKDFRDVKGDKKYGKMTFLLRYGKQATCVVSAFCWFLAAIIMSATTALAPGVLLPLILGLVQVLLLLIVLAKSMQIEKQLDIISLIAKSANILILTVLAFFLCQNQTNLSRFEMVIIPAAIGITLLLVHFPRSVEYLRSTLPRK